MCDSRAVVTGCASIPRDETRTLPRSRAPRRNLARHLRPADRRRQGDRDHQFLALDRSLARQLDAARHVLPRRRGGRRDRRPRSSPTRRRLPLLDHLAPLRAAVRASGAASARAARRGDRAAIPAADVIRLEVEADNAKGVAFYRREGFGAVGEHMEDGIRHIRMEKRLATPRAARRTRLARAPRARRPIRPPLCPRRIDGQSCRDIKKVVLAYSGGLDTSIILKWLQTTYRLRGGHLHRRSRPGRGAGAGAPQGRDARHQGDLHRGSARGIRARLRLPDVPHERALRGRLPARHLDRPPAHRQAAGRDRRTRPAPTRSPTARPARATTRCASS